MKSLKRIFKFIAKSFLFLIVASLLGYGVFRLTDWANGRTFSEYAKKHNEQIDFSKDAGFAIFDSSFYQNKLFLVGEIHGCAKTHEFDVKLIKHLNQKLGVRYYLAEIDQTQAYYFNEYLRTGNEEMCKPIFEHWVSESAQWGSKAYFEKVKAIRAYNLGLPTEKRIQFIGLDEIQDMPMSLRHLDTLLGSAFQQNSMLDSLKTMVKVPYQTSQDSSWKNFSYRLHQDMLANPNVYQALLKNNVLEFGNTIRNMASRKTIRGREQRIVNNFRHYYKEMHLENEKLYGFWGYAHTLQSGFEGGSESFAYQVMHAKDLGINDKVASINCFYLDSKMLLPTNIIPEAVRPKGRYIETRYTLDEMTNMYITGIQELKAASQPNSVTLFKLDAPNSPYTHSDRLQNMYGLLALFQSIEIDKRKLGTNGTFQYVALVRNSEWAAPY